MKTFEASHICPYTGLRSFTEEESLYFKGRDLQTDQITALLEQNRFLMVTGASGEGKSSLIYGGLIPNARAGFFKARYTNWVVADFRPERNPFSNMAASLSHHLEIEAVTVETELRRGYSSLIDLYTSSPWYAGEDEPGWLKLGEEEKKEKKRKAANLMILLDQFEEFFTNPENFFNETPSNDSQLVVNLVLETARIAIKKNLPVYVVCTMRSDYIGQCSAFRGLPEYIGFSQFFVPRLKRKDLKQVIEEPAILSGNRISQRLIERLVYDVSDGVDQLPILQHALSRIWAAAERGSEEMDLIHYAMVGGMPATELPDEDIPRFNRWFGSLPENHRRFYQDTGLNHIIEIHANLLYEDAWEYYNRQYPEKPVSQQVAKRIIGLTFSCLTKIDDSRAVRNRMTLEEVTSIINTPGLDEKLVGAVINIFREEGNSFIRPFMTEDPSSAVLHPDNVLDITHESLIRNWNKLNQWANKEFEYYSTFLDFRKQLARWKESGKSRGFLLPIGPLTYFENWYNNCKPNTGWIRRYSETHDTDDKAIKEAETVLNDTREFLKKSARREMITRAFMKYGPQRIATLLAVVILLGLSGFYWYDADQKKNENVISVIHKQSASLLSSSNVNATDKAIYLLASERYNKGSLINYLNSTDNRNRLSTGVEVYRQMMNIDKSQELPLKEELLSLLAKSFLSVEASRDPAFFIEETNKFLLALAMDIYYLPTKEKTGFYQDITDKTYGEILRFYQNKSLYKPGISTELNMALQLWLMEGRVSQGKINTLLEAVSPLSGQAATGAFNLYYAKGRFEPNGRMPFDFNAGYHTLASLYAAAGDLDKVEWCFNQLLTNNQRDYFELPRILNNHLNVLGFLYQYGHRDKVPALLTWFNTNTSDNPPATILRNTIIRAGYISHMYYINIERDYYRSTRGYLYPNLFFCDRKFFDEMCEDYEKILSANKNPDEKNYNLAMQYKRKTIFYFKYCYDRKIALDSARLDGWLTASLAYYRQTAPGYLEGTVSTTRVYNGDGVRTENIKRRILYLYPDYRDGWFSWTYHGDYFFNYLTRNQLLDTLLKSGEDLQNIHYWVAKAYEKRSGVPDEAYTKTYPLPDTVLLQILDLVDHHPQGSSFDRNLLYLLLMNHAFEQKNNARALQYLDKLNLNTISRSINRYEYLERTFMLNTMNQACIHLAASGRMNEAIRLAEYFPGKEEKIFSYLFMTETVYRQNGDPLAFSYLDSAYRISDLIDYSTTPFELDSRIIIVKILSEIGSRPINGEADEILREIQEQRKFAGILARVKGVAEEGNYYRSMTAIPSTLTESQDLQARTEILLEACRNKERGRDESPMWVSFDRFMNYPWEYIEFTPN